jgi:hypothetical protein
MSDRDVSATAVLELKGDLPIGAGKPFRPRTGNDNGGTGEELEHVAPVVQLPQLELPPVDPKLLRRPLQVGGNFVNWRVKVRIGVETTAGKMSDERADRIAEPMAEILSRSYTLREIAATRGPELQLTFELYDYAQETIAQAGIDMQRAEDRAARTAAPINEGGPPPVFPPQPTGEL